MPSTEPSLANHVYPLPYATPSLLKTISVVLPKILDPPPPDKLTATIDAVISGLPQLSLSNLSTSVTPIWRDTFALTGTLRTHYSSTSICSAWTKTTLDRNATSFGLVPDSIKHQAFGPDGTGWINAAFTFPCNAAPATACSGFISLILEDGEWKIWLIRTVLDQLTSYADVDELDPRPTALNGHSENGNYSPVGNGHAGGHSCDTSTHLPASTSVLVIGAGQAGLAVASRLQALSVPYLLIDRNAHVGDSWRNRYGGARLHTIREYSHLPMDRAFNAEDYENREWMTKEDLAEGYARWSKKFGIDQHFHGNTLVESGSWDEQSKTWTVDLIDVSIDQKKHSIVCKHIVLATGTGGQTPSMPLLPGREKFRGTILHSAEFIDSGAYKGSKGVVVGTANTAHDIAEDMLAHQLSSVTMLQRRTTYVLPTEYFSRIAALTYNPTFPTELADKLSYSMPYAVMRLLAMKGLHGMAATEPERFDALEKAGYSVERNGDIYYHILERLGGHYMDVGCCAKIVSGDIKVHQSVPVAYTPNGVICADGKEIPADLIVFATGFETRTQSQVEKLFGKDVAEGMGEFWGIDEEGELRGAFKRTGQEGLWYHGGTLGHARYFSRFIALQIKADLEGTPLPLFDEKV